MSDAHNQVNNWVDAYRFIPYVDRPEGNEGFNCWGMVRDVLMTHFNVPAEALPAYGSISSNEPALIDAGYRTVKQSFTPAAPVDGAVACCYHRGLMTHIGVVVGDNILHTGSKKGVCVDARARFERLFDVQYYVYG